MNTPSDEQLLTLIRNGASDGLKQLYERYQPPLHQFCRRFSNDEDFAKDSVHETFVKLHSKADEIRNPDALKTWLFSVARNDILSKLKRQTNHESSDEFLDATTPLDSLIEKESHHIVHHLLDQLKPEYKEVLLLCEFEEMSYAEIAAITGATASSVKSRIFKARKALIEKSKRFTEKK